MSRHDAPILNLSVPLHKKLLLSDIKAREGLHVVEITKLRDQRTLAQQGYLFGVVYPLIAPVLSAAHDSSFDRVRTHYWLKDRFLRQPTVNIHTGEVTGHDLPEFESLTKDEVSVYIDQCIQFAAENGVNVPPPSHYEIETANS